MHRNWARIVSAFLLLSLMGTACSATADVTIAPGLVEQAAERATSNLIAATAADEPADAAEPEAPTAGALASAGATSTATATSATAGSTATTQVSEALETEVIHTLPIDRRGATAVNLGGDDRFLRRSQLARSCAHLVELLQQRLGAATTRTATAAPEPADSPVPSAHAESRPEPASAELDAIEDHGDEGEDGEPDLVVWVNEGQ